MPASVASDTGPFIIVIALWINRQSHRRLEAPANHEALSRLQLVREIVLPPGLFDHVLPHELERYRQRVSTEAPYELRRHPEAVKLTGLAVYVYLRGRTLTDDLIDLLIETIHHIGARAERRVEHELLDDLKRVTGKQNPLFEVAGVALERPDGMDLACGHHFTFRTLIEAGETGRRVRVPNLPKQPGQRSVV